MDLNNFMGFSKEFALVNYKRTGHVLYLNIKRVPLPEKEVEKNEDAQMEEPPKKKPTILGFGVEGGFDTFKASPKTEDKYKIVILPDFTEFDYPNVNLPEIVKQAADAIIRNEPAVKVDEMNSWMLDLKDLPKSKHAENLKQLDNGVKIPASGWKCQNCELRQNLWLNLTDGAILCGRKQVGGLPGNSHAREYFDKNGFPLVVKLGSITADSADVYSYAEDTEVIDPLLDQHLRHFGVNISDLKKTEVSLSEMQLEAQFSHDFSSIVETGKNAEDLVGPGFTGLQNLGNTCYMNSVMQVLFSMPEFQDRYYAKRDEIFNRIGEGDPSQDFHSQMAKLSHGMLSGTYSKREELKDEESFKTDETKGKLQRKQVGLKPRMFKALIGRNHPEFATMKQQDALEFLQHVLDVVEKREHAISQNRLDPSKNLRFKVVERLECLSSHQVKYTYRYDNTVQLKIPLDKAINQAEVNAFEQKKKELEEKGLKPKDEEIVRPLIPLRACLESFIEPELIEGFFSNAINATTNAAKSTKLDTFPQYLVLAMKRFVIQEGWVPTKLQVWVDVPDELDAEFLRGTGKKPTETELPAESSSSGASSGPTPNPEIVSALTAMGMPEIRAQRAALATQNAGAEIAMNWLFEHMDDPDIDKPLPPAPGASKPGGGGGGSSKPAPSEEAISSLIDMGFNRDQAITGLKNTDLNLERAIDWLFSHPDAMDIDIPDPNPLANAGAGNNTTTNTNQLQGGADDKVVDGGSKYKLMGFISHIGSNTQSGHYVCHILKEGQWVNFNDCSVTESHDPPKRLGYLYFYKRV